MTFFQSILQFFDSVLSFLVSFAEGVVQLFTSGFSLIESVLILPPYLFPGYILGFVMFGLFVLVIRGIFK